LNFGTSKGGWLKPQNDIIINQDLGVLVLPKTLSDTTRNVLKLEIGEKMKHPIVEGNVISNGRPYIYLLDTLFLKPQKVFLIML